MGQSFLAIDSCANPALSRYSRGLPPRPALSRVRREFNAAPTLAPGTGRSAARLAAGRWRPCSSGRERQPVRAQGGGSNAGRVEWGPTVGHAPASWESPPNCTARQCEGIFPRTLACIRPPRRVRSECDCRHDQVKGSVPSSATAQSTSTCPLTVTDAQSPLRGRRANARQHTAGESWRHECGDVRMGNKPTSQRPRASVTATTRRVVTIGRRLGRCPLA